MVLAFTKANVTRMETPVEKVVGSAQNQRWSQEGINIGKVLFSKAHSKAMLLKDLVSLFVIC